MFRTPLRVGRWARIRSSQFSRRWRDVPRGVPTPRRRVSFAQGVTNRIVVSAEIVSETPQQMLPKIDRLKDHLPADFRIGHCNFVSEDQRHPNARSNVPRSLPWQSYCWPVPVFKAAASRFWSWNRAPDYLVLSEIMLRGVTAGSQPARRLEQVLTACQRLGIKAVLPLCSCERTVAHCRQMGYELGLQTTTPADNLAAL